MEDIGEKDWSHENACQSACQFESPMEIKWLFSKSHIFLISRPILLSPSGIILLVQFLILKTLFATTNFLNPFISIIYCV